MGKRAIFVATTALAVLVAALIASCGTFSGVSESPGVADGAIADGFADGSFTDAQSLSDASNGSTDGGSPSVGPADASFCANQSSKPLYCDDFDEYEAGANLPSSDEYLPGGGTAIRAVASDTAVSAPNAAVFHVSAGATDNGDGRTSAVFRGFAGVTHTADLKFSVHLDAATDPNTNVVLASLGFGGSGGTPAYSVLLQMSGSGVASIQQTSGSANSTQSLDNAPVIGGWSLVDMLLDFDSAEITVTIDTKQTALDMSDQKTGSVSLSYGVAYFGGSGVIATTARFDNVWLDGN